MTTASIAIESYEGDAPGNLREALKALSTLGSDLTNTDFYLGFPGMHEGERSSSMVGASSACRRTYRVQATFATKLSAAQLHEHVNAIAREYDVTFGPASGEPAGARLAGTAVLQPPKRLDYDDPDGAGAQYDTLRPFSTFDRAVLECVLGAAGPLAGKRVLDVGCGTGRFTERLAHEGARVTGLDPSETMLAAARARTPKADITYVRGDANGALPAGPFDVVTAFYCIQYLDVGPWCRAVKNVLVPGGAVAIATFPHRHFTENAYAIFFPSLPAVDMARFPSIPALRSMLRASGFARTNVYDRVIEIVDEPKALIDRIERKYLSSFYLLPDSEFQAGVAAMRAQWNGLRSVLRIARSAVVAGWVDRSAAE